MKKIFDVLVEVCENDVFSLNETPSVFWDGIRLIGKRAFCACSQNLERVIIPNKVERIDDQAFYGCKNLKSVILPKDLQFIEKQTFSNCLSLVNVHIPDGVASIREDAFSFCERLKSLKFPSKLKKIERFAFDNCVSLERVDLANVEEIFDNAFSNCSNLETISFGDSLTTLGSKVFWGCDKLKKVILPASIESIGRNCFPETLDNVWLVCDDNIIRKVKTLVFKCGMDKESLQNLRSQLSKQALPTLCAFPNSTTKSNNEGSGTPNMLEK